MTKKLPAPQRAGRRLQNQVAAGQAAAAAASDARQRKLNALGDAQGSPNVRGPQRGRGR